MKKYMEQNVFLKDEISPGKKSEKAILSKKEIMQVTRSLTLV